MRPRCLGAFVQTLQEGNSAQSASQSTEDSGNLHLLSSISPQIPVDTIREVYERNGCDLQKACDALLELEYGTEKETTEVQQSTDGSASASGVDLSVSDNLNVLHMVFPNCSSEELQRWVSGLAVILLTCCRALDSASGDVDKAAAAVAERILAHDSGPTFAEADLDPDMKPEDEQLRKTLREMFPKVPKHKIWRAIRSSSSIDEAMSFLLGERKLEAPQSMSLRDFQQALPVPHFFSS